MTIEMALVLARLKERNALELFRRAIVAGATDPAWLYLVQALDTRLDALRDQLARENPQMLRDCEALQRPLRDPSADDAFLRSIHISAS
jgi:hypothetical protein